jgi:hypothetical protein
MTDIDDVAVTTGTGVTLTVTNAVLVQPAAEVPVTVYVVVVAGDAFGFGQLVHDKPVEGDQE